MKFPIRKNDGVKRPPLRTFKEMAEELGVARQAIVREFRFHPEGAPSPTFTHRNGDTPGSRHTWYNRADFLKWWKSIPRG